MISDSCHDGLSGGASELIVTKIDLLETSLLGDKLRKKVYVSRSIFLLLSVVIFLRLFVLIGFGIGDPVFSE